MIASRNRRQIDWRLPDEPPIDVDSGGWWIGTDEDRPCGATRCADRGRSISGCSGDADQRECEGGVVLHVARF
jgi:hypothetical protein